MWTEWTDVSHSSWVHTLHMRYIVSHVHYPFIGWCQIGQFSGVFLGSGCRRRHYACSVRVIKWCGVWHKHTDLHTVNMQSRSVYYLWFACTWNNHSLYNIFLSLFFLLSALQIYSSCYGGMYPFKAQTGFSIAHMCEWTRLLSIKANVACVW